MKTIRFGTRRSALAQAQTRLVMEAVEKAHPDYQLEMVPITTSGDTNMKPFSEASDKAGIKGLFTQELEEALLDGRIDAAVHSLKDLPSAPNPELPLIACFRREDPRDVLVLPAGSDTDTPLKTIGCSSARRRLQLAPLFPGTVVEPVRGNVNTRLRKLDEGQFSALVLAAAGLKRLGLESRISHFFTPDEMIPAPGQGILAVQGRRSSEYDSWIGCVSDRDAEDCAAAERAFSLTLGGGCVSPAGALAEVSGNEMRLRGFFADEQRHFACRRSLTGLRSQARRLGEELAEQILKEMR
jgi:hydroxymethylbilane synthase